MDPEVVARLAELEKKLDLVHKRVEEIRKYFLFSAIATLVFLVLPLVAMVFILPMAISTITSSYDFGIIDTY